MKHKLNKNDVLFIERKEYPFLHYRIFFLASERARKLGFHVNTDSSFYQEHRSEFERYDLRIKEDEDNPENGKIFLGLNFISLLENEYKTLIERKGLLNLNETTFPLSYHAPGPIQLSFKNLNNCYTLINK